MQPCSRPPGKIGHAWETGAASVCRQRQTNKQGSPGELPTRLTPFRLDCPFLEDGIVWPVHSKSIHLASLVLSSPVHRVCCTPTLFRGELVGNQELPSFCSPGLKARLLFRRPYQNGVSAPYFLLTRKISGKKLPVQVVDIPPVLPPINAWGRTPLIGGRERSVTTALPVLFLLERLPDCFVRCSPPGVQKRFPVTGQKRFGKSEVRERFAPCSWWEEPMKSQSRYLLIEEIACAASDLSGAHALARQRSKVVATRKTET